MSLDEGIAEGNATISYVPYRTLNTFGDSGTIGTIVKFDDYEELLWTASKEGRISSYCGPYLSRYTTFSTLYDAELKDMCVTDPGILTLTSCGLNLHKRGGGLLYATGLSSPGVFSSCLAVSAATTCYPNGSIVIAGKHGSARKLNLERPDYIENLQIADIDTVFLRGSERYLCFASSGGDISIVDLRSNQARHHRAIPDSMILCDVDVYDYSLFMCVHGVDSIDNILPSYSLSVYDLRVCKATSPINTCLAPSLVRFMPKSFGQYCVAVDMEGRFQFINSFASAEVCEEVHRLGNFAAAPVSIDFSSSANSFVIGDAAGLVHIFSRGNPSSHPQWNSHSRPCAVPELLYHNIGHTASAHYRSDGPSAGTSHPLLRSQINSQSWPTTSTAGLESPQKSVALEVAEGRPVGLPKDSPVPFTPTNGCKADTVSMGRSRSRMPQISWREFNSSNLPALEPELPSSYCNGILQALYNIGPLAAIFQNHHCYNEFCLSCELGFLFHMMNVAGSEEPCQASNLYRVIRSMDSAVHRGLVISEVDDLSGTMPQILLQQWIQFVLEHTHKELMHDGYYASQDSSISRLASVRVLDTITHTCGHISQEQRTLFTLPLRYFGAQNHRGQDLHYILRNTLNECSEWVLHCDTCGFENVACFTRNVTSLPEIFVFNFRLDNENNATAMKQTLANWTIQQLIKKKAESSPLTLKDVKACRYGAQCNRMDCLFLHPRDIEAECSKSDPPTFIPTSLWMNIGSDGKTEVVNTRPLGRQKWTEYEVAAVTYIARCKEKGDSQSFVSAIKVRNRSGGADPWHFFDDLIITPVSQREALHFDLNSRIPCTVFYARADVQKRWPTTVDNPITRDIFLRYCEQSIPPGHHEPSSIIPIQETECFGPSDVVALDAEFVSLSDGEVEFHADGTKSIIKPSMMSLGRVTVVRGHGVLAGTPFMDEYVVARDKIVDHLTEFSGIQPGDLCADFSSKRLQTLKSVYVRLRYLVDQGVRFIGHGLNNDFRVINIKVPKDQIIDTVQLFRLPDQRLISLRFLAWYFLGSHIQIHSHDSIEDAQSALYLYQKYEALTKDSSKSDGSTFVKVLTQMYEIGRSLQWKIPVPES
ncbi:PAN2-PAN3 deadenylation complex catalytic subunit Pan2-like [Paramacrobiotus metropolitanus]|uniref:PAN2-PAN3 deadenylation complex catalytic subunit Pan2-like n=1 Tax=Paramacrobiotus metropolitanus TaxID=2943436 RepID=UPI0024456DAA|nr:PAN2-PAN3 deadenylation complex catalytic subunit Pan2-like [Paramacrobiotus metropolitanus]